MEQSPLQPTPVGAFRFNTDSSKMEYYDGNQWVNITSTSPEVQTGGTRGMYNGMNAPTYTCDYLNLSSGGDAADFGNLATQRYRLTSAADRTRAIQAGGEGGNNVIDYFTMATTGNGTDFGDCYDHYDGWSVNNTTRYVFGAGSVAPNYGVGLNTIEYVTIQSTGNSNDFGDCYITMAGCTAAASPTRGYMSSTYDPSPGANQKIIQYITTSTLGNSSYFGDLTNTDMQSDAVCVANATRGFICGGYNSTSPALASNTIEYVTIASLGNATDFGDLNYKAYLSAGCGSPTRATYAGGAAQPGPAKFNNIDYWQIASAGNATDFGNLTESAYVQGGCSNGNGGLG